MSDTVSDMPTAYMPPARKKVQLSTRIAPELLDYVQDVRRLWETFAEERGDEAGAVDMAYTVARLLSVGCDAAFAELGGRPTTEAQWRTLANAIKGTLKKS